MFLQFFFFFLSPVISPSPIRSLSRSTPELLREIVGVGGLTREMRAADGKGNPVTGALETPRWYLRRHGNGEGVPGLF